MGIKYKRGHTRFEDWNMYVSRDIQVKNKWRWIAWRNRKFETPYTIVADDNVGTTFATTLFCLILEHIHE